MSRTDAERRGETRKLLAMGALHTLAMVAVSKGDTTAIRIAAATLDRHLEKVGQKQIFGTQFSSDPKSTWTQEPYDRELVSDALRRQLGGPPQSVQAERLKAYQARIDMSVGAGR